MHYIDLIPVIIKFVYTNLWRIIGKLLNYSPEFEINARREQEFIENNNSGELSVMIENKNCFFPSFYRLSPFCGCMHTKNSWNGFFHTCGRKSRSLINVNGFKINLMETVN